MTSQDRRTWFITGASAGFGRAIAECALGRGDNVALAVRRPGAVAGIEAAYPGQVSVVELDVCDTGRAPLAVRAAVERFGRVDVLVNNAGRGIVGAAEEVTGEELRASLELHLLGPAALVRAVLPFFREQRCGHDRADEQPGRAPVLPRVSARTRPGSSRWRAGRRRWPARSRRSGSA